MMNTIVKSAILLVFLGSTTSAHIDSCEEYCDFRGRLQDYKLCSYQQPYCCGRTDFRYCCKYTNRRLTPEQQVNNCPRTQSWRAVMGTLLLGGAFILCCLTCFCFCCRGRCSKRDTRSANELRSQNRNGSRNHGSNQEGSSPVATVFNPASEYAFQPPAYETLPKDPPKYADIFHGQTNLAFVNERSETSGGPRNDRDENEQVRNKPPPYSTGLPPVETTESSNPERNEGSDQNGIRSERSRVSGADNNSLLSNNTRTNNQDELPAYSESENTQNRSTSRVN